MNIEDRWRHVTAFAVLVSVLLTGCLHVAYEPPLPMPARPNITFTLCDPAHPMTSPLCMSQVDANALAKFFEKLNAFEEQRNAALKTKSFGP